MTKKQMLLGLMVQISLMVGLATANHGPSGRDHHHGNTTSVEGTNQVLGVGTLPETTSGENLIVGGTLARRNDFKK
jgi:hypothetical protein